MTAFDGGEVRATVLAVHLTQDPINGEVSPSIGVTSGSIGVTSGSIGVRRLTPVECERLMGWPDNHTAWGVDEDGNRKDMPDSTRYRMVGNGVMSPVAEWIGRQLLEAR